MTCEPDFSGGFCLVRVKGWEIFESKEKSVTSRLKILGDHPTLSR